MFPVDRESVEGCAPCEPLKTQTGWAATVSNIPKPEWKEGSGMYHDSNGFSQLIGWNQS